MSENEDLDVAVIGGGINGLAVAALLIEKGYRVAVFEKESEVGGRVRVVNNRDFLMENGLHLLKYADNSALMGVIRKLPGGNSISIIPIKHYFLYIGDEAKKIKKNLYVRTTSKWLDKGWISVPKNFKEIRRHSYFSAWNLMRIYTTGFKYPYDEIKDMSIKEFEEKINLNEISSRYLRLTAGALLHCPFSSVASVGETLRTIRWAAKQPTLFGYPRGGWKSLLDFLKGIVEKKGKLYTGVRVESVCAEEIGSDDPLIEKKDVLNWVIDKKNYRITGIKTSKGEFGARTVIVATALKQVVGFFGKKDAPPLPPKVEEFCKNAIPTSGISIDFALKSKAYGGKSMLYTENPTGYGIFLSNIDPSIAPPGKQLFRACIPLSPLHVDNPDIINEYIDKAKEYIFGLLPKIKPRIEFEQISVHKIVDSVQINTKQYMDARPKTRVPTIFGCFLTGDYINSYGAGGEIGYNAISKTVKWADIFLKNTK